MTRRRRTTRIQRRARRDVNLAYRPQLRELNRQGRQTRSEYKDYDAKMGALYGILDNTLAQTGTSGQAALGQVGQQYQTGVQGILAGLGQSAAPGQADFLNTLGSFALAGQNALSTDAARESNLGSSMRRQGGLERMQLGRNIRDDLQEALDDIRFARRGIKSDRGMAYLSRLDQLRDDQFSRQMALKELALRRAAVAREGGNNAAYLSFLRDQAGLALDTGTKPKPKPKPKPRTRSRRRRGSAIATGQDKRRQP